MPTKKKKRFILWGKEKRIFPGRKDGFRREEKKEEE